MPAPLRRATGEFDYWNITGAMAAGLQELPKGHECTMRILNGHYVEAFLRRQPEWQELKVGCQAKGTWLRPYVFRESFSLRFHSSAVEVGAIASAMGPSLAVHGASYRWAPEKTTAAAFEAALQK
jgi:hypothetical protein